MCQRINISPLSPGTSRESWWPPPPPLSGHSGRYVCHWHSREHSCQVIISIAIMGTLLAPVIILQAWVGSAGSADAWPLLRVGAVLFTRSHLPTAVHTKRPHMVLLRYVKHNHSPIYEKDPPCLLSVQDYTLTSLSLQSKFVHSSAAS